MPSIRFVRPIRTVNDALVRPMEILALGNLSDTEKRKSMVKKFAEIRPEPANGPCANVTSPLPKPTLPTQMFLMMIFIFFGRLWKIGGTQKKTVHVGAGPGQKTHNVVETLMGHIPYTMPLNKLVAMARCDLEIHVNPQATGWSKYLLKM